MSKFKIESNRWIVAENNINSAKILDEYYGNIAIVFDHRFLKLIAAAPELLEALELAHNQLCQGDTISERYITSEIERVIRKAKGVK